MQAGPTNLVPLDYSNGEPSCRTVKSCGITAWPSADNHDVVHACVTGRWDHLQSKTPRTLLAAELPAVQPSCGFSGWLQPSPYRCTRTLQPRPYGCTRTYTYL